MHNLFRACCCVAVVNLFVFGSCSFRGLRFAIFDVAFFACNHSARPPGGNQVDGLPPALHLVHNFGSVGWILISLRQCGVKTSRMDMVRAMVPSKFIEDGKR